MPSLKFIKTRIKSVKSTQKIIKAVQLISASRFYKIREKLYASIPYYNEIKEIMKGISFPFYIRNDKTNNYIFNNNINTNKYLLIIITSDKGLCGNFNINIIKNANIILSKLIALNKKIHIIFIGKTGYKLFNKKNIKFESCKIYTNKFFMFPDVIKIRKTILKLFYDKQFSICNVIYSKFISIVQRRIVNKQLIPFSYNNITEYLKRKNIIYSYEPSIKKLNEYFFPKFIETQIYHILLENAASENSARMIAMDIAAHNSSKIIKMLKNIYNKIRQNKITKELSEIITGAQSILQ